MSADVAGYGVVQLRTNELALGFPFGHESGAPLGRSKGSPRAVLEEVLLECLSGAPCGVSFSGGRDSSALLALATHLARGHGLELPVPVTLIFGDAASDEHEWQTMVLRHLGLSDWRRIDATTALKLTGGHASRMVGQYGVHFPANSYSHLPMADELAGGTLISGVGGDEVFASPPEALIRALGGKSRLHLKDVARFVANSFPQRVSRTGDRLLAGRHWLRPMQLPMLARDVGSAFWDGPRRFDASLRRWVRSRYYLSAEQSLSRVGLLADCRVVAPFLDPRFLAAFATSSGIGGPKSRTAAMEGLVGDLLPRESVDRRSKATFNVALYKPDQAFLEGWGGEGVPQDLVDVDALRSEWRKLAPHAGADLLLQSAFFTWNGVLPRS